MKKKKTSPLKEDEVRVIKISEEALFEFIYEKFIDDHECYLDVEPVSVTNSFYIDWENRQFIFCAYKTENEKGEFWSKDMNSFNHYAYGSVADWIYEEACGIKILEAGFTKIQIAPKPTDMLDHLSAKIITKHGAVSSKWYHVDGKIRYEIETPTESTIIINGTTHQVPKGKYIFSFHLICV